MSKDSAESDRELSDGHPYVFDSLNDVPNTDAPGRNVTVSFPALITSLWYVLYIRAGLIASNSDSNLRVKLIFGGIGSHTKDTVLALQPDSNTRCQIL